MIAHTWRCRTDALRADALLTHLQNTGIAEARDIQGYCGHLLTRRTDNNAEVEFTLVTFWSDMHAVKRFAGDAPDTARLYPGDEQHLTTADQHVTHAEIVDHQL
jgi:hypothetical protein